MSGKEIGWFEILTLFGLVAGPVLAILVGRLLESFKLKRERRMEIFRALMRTRRVRLAPEHVGALNLVEIEFQGKEDVLREWRAYFEHLGKSYPELSGGVSGEGGVDNSEVIQKTIRDGEKLLAKLLHSIARVMGFKIEQLDIFEGGYAPRGWSNIEQQQQVIRDFMVDMYNGKRYLPVAVTDFREFLSDRQSAGDAVAKEDDVGT